MAFIKKHSTLLVMGLLFVLGLTFRLWAAGLNWMHYDENYYINIAQNFAARGEWTPYMWRLGNLPILSGGGSGYGIIVLIAWLRAVDYSLFWGRVLMIAVNAANAFVLYWIARRWWSSRLAGLAAFGYAVVATSSFNTMIVKMDAIGILSYSLVLLLYTFAREKKQFWLHLLVGLASVVTAEFHVLGVVYLLAIGICYAYDFLLDSVRQRKIALSRQVAGFALGGSLAGGLYLLIHVLPDPRAYFIISQSCFECNEDILTTELKRLLRMLVFRPHEVIVIFAMIVFTFLRRKEADRRYLVLVLGWLLAQAVVGPPPYDHYFNHFWPVVALGVGGWVAYGSGPKPQPWRVPVSVMLALVFLCANLGMYLNGSYLSLLSYSLKPDAAVEYIQKNVSTDTVVMSNVPNFYYLRNYPNYLSYRDGSVYGAMLRGESMLTFWRRVRPQVILVDPQLEQEDSDLQTYLAEGAFKEIMTGLWTR